MNRRPPISKRTDTLFPFTTRVRSAIEQRKLGRPLREAVIEAARLRFRPILMTSFAFIMGVLPMAVSTGAGANARHAIGTGVIGGMLFATILGLLLIPRSEEHTSELQSLMRISYAVFCLNKKN